jgi:hypothetical protein
VFSGDKARGFSASRRAALAWVVVVTAFLICGPAQALNDHLIVPWVRIGPIELGMTVPDLIRILGAPTQKVGGPLDSVVVYSWKNDLSAYVRSDGSYVTQVCALSAAYATAEGVHPDLADLTATFLLGQARSSRVRSRWGIFSYIDLFWPGLMIRVPLKGFDTNHLVQAVCVNHSAAIPE